MMVGLSACAVVLLVFLIIAVVLLTTRRRLLLAKCRWRRPRRRVDGGSEMNDPEQCLANNDSCRRLLDTAAGTAATAALTAPCNGAEFHLTVVTPDSAAAASDNASPRSSLSSGACSDVRLDRGRQLGDGGSGTCCEDVELICASLKREMLAARSVMWDCQHPCHCQHSTPMMSTALQTPADADVTSVSNHCLGLTSCRHHRAAALGPATGERTVPRCHVATPHCFRSRPIGSVMASTGDKSARRPRSCCSCA